LPQAGHPQSQSGAADVLARFIRISSESPLCKVMPGTWLTAFNSTPRRHVNEVSLREALARISSAGLV
jgi:hypothetical protein